MTVLGVVPARGGSKRLPRKNIAFLGGKPLIVWTLRAARASNALDRVIVTTDDLEIANVIQMYNEEEGDNVFVWMRPSQLARDETPMLPVILNVYNSNPADIIVTLQPTSPFRKPEAIATAISLLRSTKADSVFSVTEAPDDLAFEVGHANRLRKLPNVVVPNGSLFLITGEALERGESWFSGLAYGYSMPKDESLDIDTQLDLEIAKMILGQGKAA